MIYFFLFLIGLGIGSFLNVVSLRYAEERRLLDLGVIGGRSHCRMCQRQLRWYELIPLFSFLFLRGRCRTCGTRLLWQYPIVELLSGVIFAAVPYALNLQLITYHLPLINDLQLTTYYLQQFDPLVISYWLLVISWVLVFELFLLLSAIDFRLYIIPNQINALLGVLGVVITFLESRAGLFGEFYGSFVGHYAALFGLRESIWVNHAVAALGAGIFFVLIIVVTRGRGMGWGDVKLVIPLGLLFGWPDIAFLIALSFVAGSIVVLPLLFRKQKHMKDQVPFGPFLVMGATLVFFFGYELLKLYFSFFRIT